MDAYTFEGIVAYPPRKHKMENRLSHRKTAAVPEHFATVFFVWLFLRVGLYVQTNKGRHNHKINYYGHEVIQ